MKTQHGELLACCKMRWLHMFNDDTASASNTVILVIPHPHSGRRSTVHIRVFVCSQTLWIGALLLKHSAGLGAQGEVVPGVFGLNSVWSPALWKAVWLIRLWVVIQQSDSPRWAALSCNPRGVKDISAIWCLNNVSHVIGLKRLNGLTSWLLVKWLTCDKITETAQCEGKHNTCTTCSVCGRSSERNTPGQFVEEASSALRATESHIWSPMGVSPRGAWTPMDPLPNQPGCENRCGSHSATVSGEPTSHVSGICDCILNIKYCALAAVIMCIS